MASHDDIEELGEAKFIAAERNGENGCAYKHHIVTAVTAVSAVVSEGGSSESVIIPCQKGISHWKCFYTMYNVFRTHENEGVWCVLKELRLREYSFTISGRPVAILQLNGSIQEVDLVYM